jgi:FtsZ-binding cell division protein ZapB
MTEKTSQWEPMGLERFSHLEDKIHRVVEGFKTMRQENASLREENQALRAELESFRRSESDFNENLVQLQKEREELRDRVEKALSLLETLEVGETG